MSAITLSLHQPAQVGAHARSDAVLGTQTHIPGAVVRGALAATWIAEHGAPTPASPRRADFLELFEGGVRFGPLFAGEPFLPLSVLVHKYEPKSSCLYNAIDEAVHGPVSPQCAECGSPLERTTALEGSNVPVRRRTSVAIGAAGVAERGRLFSRDSLSPRDSAGNRSVFTGHLVARDTAHLTALATLDVVRIGGRRTTHGLAHVNIDPTHPVAVPARLDDHHVIVRLRSPGAFVDDLGRPSRDPNGAELRSLLGSDVTIEARWTRWQSVGGWHVASGLPKPTELVVAPGSTYLVRAAAPVTDDALRELGRRGLGLRRHEGFGDLGGAPVLPLGRLERERRQAQLTAHENARLRALAESVRPILGLNSWKEWPTLAGLLRAHAQGDAAATARLRGVTARLHTPATRAVDALLGYDLTDAAAVLNMLEVR